jgi:hypothetical protein
MFNNKQLTKFIVCSRYGAMVENLVLQCGSEGFKYSKLALYLTRLNG